LIRTSRLQEVFGAGTPIIIMPPHIIAHGIPAFIMVIMR
jgi:hypothetical protein